MPGIITTELGKISISEDIIAMIAGYAASENYGIYGTSLSAVAKNAIENVRYRVKEMTGLNVRNVNIHVEAIRA